MGVARTIRLKAFLLFFVACIATTIFFRPGLSPNIKNPHYASDTTKASSGTKSGTPKAGSVEGNDNAIKTMYVLNPKLHINPFSDNTNSITSSKAAAIVESRLDPKLIPIFLHFSAILGPDWPIVMFTTNVTYTRLMTSPPPSLSRLLRTGGLILKLFPAGVGNLEVTNDYSDFLTRTYMWEELAPAENILVFQSDSMLCSKAPLTVEDFLEFDFIGAPYDPNHGKGFNGGLSLRKRSSTLRVLSRFVRAQYEMPAYEDQWYYERLV
jgi:hypothetical protein